MADYTVGALIQLYLCEYLGIFRSKALFTALCIKKFPIRFSYQVFYAAYEVQDNFR